MYTVETIENIGTDYNIDTYSEVISNTKTFKISDWWAFIPYLGVSISKAITDETPVTIVFGGFSINSPAYISKNGFVAALQEYFAISGIVIPDIIKYEVEPVITGEFLEINDN